MAILIVIGGPTASGKTKAAIALAKKLSCPILSADSRQFFREMTIGTAKPNDQELQQAQHYFINNKSIEEDYSAGIFEEEAQQLLNELFQKHQYVILVGGSGLYIDALCLGMDQLPKSPEFRHALNQIFLTQGLEVLQKELKRTDPEYYEKCDIQNPIRVIRALEIMRLTNLKMRDVLSQNKKPKNFKTLFFVLDLEREELYERINLRVNEMIEHGLIEETEKLLLFKEKHALQTVGYKELFDYHEGKHDLQQAISLIKQNSRRYAKRQITWFKRYKDAIWIKPTAFDNIDEFIIHYLPEIEVK